MPLYEYFCRECDGVFELLRPAREASKAQPCPVCDEDADRIISREWAAFTFRDGYPRRLPDDGSYWHLGKKVSQPISGPSDGYTHPELKKKAPPPEPSIEDVERYEVLRDVKRQRELSAQTQIHDETVQQQDERMRRALRQRGSTKVEREKQRIMRKLSAEDAKAQYSLRQEQASRVQSTRKRRRADGEG